MSSEEKTAASWPASGGRVHSRRARLLITDDRPEVMAMVEGGLGRRYDCEFTAGLAQARAKLAAEAFQVAICDLQTPREAGLVQVEEIARDYPETAIVLITDVDDPEVTERTFQLGAHGYIVKPFWPGQLLITVKNALRQRELELALRKSSQAEEIRLRDEMAAAQRRAIAVLRVSRQETVQRLAMAIDLHDASTGAHVERMAAIASFLAERLELGAEFVELMQLAAPMHDVGKIGVLAEILRKPGPLTAAERAAMERHTIIGHETLANSESELLRMAATIALSHHERYDGDGYPHGLRGEEIPLEGRIAAVADVFDALLTDRCYRAAFSAGDAVAKIAEENGSHFDPWVADVLLENVEEVLVLRG